MVKAGDPETAAGRSATSVLIMIEAMMRLWKGKEGPHQCHIDVSLLYSPVLIT